MNGDERERKQDDYGKNPFPGDTSQWAMFALNQINTRLTNIESDVRGLSDDIRVLGRSVDNMKKVIWTAAGVVIAVGVIGGILVGFLDLLTKIPFEINIQNTPADGGES